MCLNIGLGFMEIPDTPLSMPDHYGNCGAQYEAVVGDGGMVPIADLMDRGIGNGTIIIIYTCTIYSKVSSNS